MEKAEEKVDEEVEEIESNMEEDTVEEEANWSKVSPTKVGKSNEKQEEIQYLGSPSRFAILEKDEEEEAESGEKLENEEREIKEKEEKEQLKTVKQVERTVRVTPPRTTKIINKHSAKNLALDTKETLPSVSSRRRPRDT